MSPPYRAENIGSLLRPAYLHQARQDWQQGQLSLPDFKRVEDRAVNEAIALPGGGRTRNRYRRRNAPLGVYRQPDRGDRGHRARPGSRCSGTGPHPRMT